MFLYWSIEDDVPAYRPGEVPASACLSLVPVAKPAASASMADFEDDPLARREKKVGVAEASGLTNAAILSMYGVGSARASLC